LHAYGELTERPERGGWPLSMFLTPDGKPILGGTYFPREDREIEGQKVRGFKTILKRIAEVYKEEPKKVQQQAEAVAKGTIRLLEGGGRFTPLFELKRDLLGETVAELEGQFDKVHGGFGKVGTKFPTTPRLLFLEEEGERTKDRSVVKILDVTLDRMARGG